MCHTSQRIRDHPVKEVARDIHYRASSIGLITQDTDPINGHGYQSN